MTFEDALNVVSMELSKHYWTLKGNYDGLIVKKLESSNTLDANRTTKQSHIAITGPQMDFFPFIRLDGYFAGNYDDQNEELKKYYVAQIPVWLSRKNVEYYSSEQIITFSEDTKKTYASVVRSRRKDAADQIQVSMIYIDSPDFVSFRRMIHSGDYIVMLKRKAKLEYELYAIKGNEVPDNDQFAGLNQKFFNGKASTPVRVDELSSIHINEERLKGASNIVLYGVPGCGKSHEIKTKFCNDDTYMERAVFHPDYTYSDFTGQILPKVTDHKVSYEFEPGPFTRILKKAVNNPGEYFYLVIEEINRGNAPAIFGDVFQLLDRDENGESEYGISNEAMADIVYDDKEHKVKLPSNLFILATMNTSDQNVFTLDTAFKRRWKMRLVENDIDKCKFAEHHICGSNITWAEFAKCINDLIIEVKTENLSNEDNRLGAYFVNESELDDPDLFGEKVLMYLWNDAFKYDHDKVFKRQYRTLDELIYGFKSTRFSIFEDAIGFSMDSTDVVGETYNKAEEVVDYVVDGSPEVVVERYIAGKKDYLVEYYNRLFGKVRECVPSVCAVSRESLTYVSWKADKSASTGFADFVIRDDGIVIYTEKPVDVSMMDIGVLLPADNHKNHYFRIQYRNDQVEKIVSVLVESYEQLKGE